MVIKFRTFLIAFIILLQCQQLLAQSAYVDSLKAWRQRYINNHEVVTGNNREHLQFFPVNPAARVQARIEYPTKSPWFTMETSSGMKKTFRVYAIAHFQWRDSSCQLSIYQSQGLLGDVNYRDYLFLPFTDLTNETATYEMGRYIDLKVQDIQQNLLEIDFNKAYNPYCAYTSGQYNCPIPPAENNLNVKIEAGEKKFQKLK
ncbi:MAG: DUF1684 domain-containing protein [Chitinophagaceae bacterium]